MRRLLNGIHAFLKSRFFSPAVFFGCLAPGLILGWRTYQGDLGVNAIETLLHQTGRTALAILLLTLTITPLRRITGWNRIQVVRRMMGVWSFFYALCHFSIYFVFDQLGDVAAIWDDVANRPFIFMGMLAFAILVALAATSFNTAIRMLGRNWQRLHRAVYVGATAGVIHFLWGQKADIQEPIKWAIWLVALLGLRVWFAVRKRRAKRPSAVTA